MRPRLKDAPMVQWRFIDVQVSAAALPSATGLRSEVQSKNRTRRAAFSASQQLGGPKFLEYSSGGFVRRDLLTNKGFHVKRSD